MITLCKNCPEAIYQNDASYWVHRDTAAMWCAQTSIDRPVAALGVEVWETESPDLVIVGTTDRAAAEIAAQKFYTEVVGEVPDDLHEAVQGARLEWVNRGHGDYDSETWPDDVHSEVERPGDSPALIWGW